MKYTHYMLNFETTALKKYLGEEIVDTLIEWLPNGDTLLTRERLVSMIDSVHGMDILKNREFRRDLLCAMEPNKIKEIRDRCLKGSEGDEEDLIKVANTIAEKPWRRSLLTEYLAKLWEVPESAFDTPVDTSMTMNTITSGERFFELLDYQYFIKQQALNILNSGNMQERFLIHMPTGTGKTKTTMHTITNFMEFSLEKKGLVIWIAHTTELLQQAYDTFCEVWSHLGDGEINAYRLWGSHTIENTEEQLNGIAFVGLAKLMSIYDTDKELFNRLHEDARLIVFDEAHKAAADRTKEIINKLLSMPKGKENRALIGLTATPGRTTQKSYDNTLLTNMFGNKLISIDSAILNKVNKGKQEALNSIVEDNIIRYFQNRKILSKMHIERLQYESTFSEEELKKIKKGLRDLGYDGTDFSESQLQIFAQNKSRNKVIMDRLKKLSEEKVPTIVFACSVNHAKMISAMLTLENIPNSLILGNMNPILRRKAIDEFKNRETNVNFIVNYEVLTTGFDAKNIKCVFITRPTKSVVLYSQMLGRGLRGPLMGGNEECCLIDVDDNIDAFDNEMAFEHFNDYWI